MLGPTNRQTIQTEVANDFRNGIEWLTEFTEDVATVIVLLDAHVHETFGASAKGGEG